MQGPGDDGDEKEGQAGAGREGEKHYISAQQADLHWPVLPE